MGYNVRFETDFLGRVIVLDNGSIECGISLDVGPRIISFNKVGGRNVLYQDRLDLVNKDCSKVYGHGQVWHIYGGHRLWLSPEDLSTYFPDNNPVCYKMTKNGILVYPPKWNVVEIQPQMLIEFSGKNQLKVTHTVQNLGEKRQLCLWALTVMRSGGTMSLELPKHDTGFLPNRNIVWWPYTKMDDKRISVNDHSIVAKSDVRVPNPCKIGTYNSNIVVEYALQENGEKTTFVKKTQSTDGASYPDFHCNFECYFNDKIHEIETLSSIREVEKGQDIEHVEWWEIY